MERSVQFAAIYLGPKWTLPSVDELRFSTDARSAADRGADLRCDQLSCVQPDEPLPLAVQTHLARVLKSTEERRLSIRLLQDYRKEWLTLIEAGLKAGRHWARWHGPISSSSARSVA